MRRLAMQTALGFAAALLLPVAAAGMTFTDLFVFGDSLSDAGNAVVVSGGVEPASPPYAGRNSNGPVGVEYLAQRLGLALGPSVAGGTDYAVAGAMTGPDPLGVDNFNFYRLQALGFPPDVAALFLGTGVQAQVGAFLGTSPSFPGDSSLFVVWASPNDVFAWLTNPARRTLPDLIAAGVGNLVNAIGVLAQAGAERFLVPNLPDLGLTPFARLAGQEAALTELSDMFNLFLGLALSDLDAALPAQIIPFDVAGALRRVAGDPARFGFDNVSAPCLDPITSAVCANPNRYAFWDLVHPTTAAHRLLGAQFAAAVPLPGTAWLVVAGVLTALAVCRRRRRWGGGAAHPTAAASRGSMSARRASIGG